MNKKGFIVIETIIVMSILAIGLIGLYSSYTLIVKNSKANTNVVNNTFLALQISEYKKYTTTNTNTYYIELYDNGTKFYKRECTTSSCSSSALSTEETNIYKNLNIDKVYIATKTFSDLYNSNVILNMDGSTIRYLQSIKNNPDIKKDESIIIVKVKNGKETEFSFYQETEFYERGLLTSIILQNNTPTSPVTSPGVKGATERILSSTMDDYGLSYYFRGSVQNNYLVFANMCWRVVRIMGNGDIKIVLYNHNPNNVTNPCASSEDATDRAFAKYDSSENGQAGKSEFNPNKNSNAYIGFMYGDVSGTTYEAVHANTIDSTILTNLKTWYDDKFTDDQKGMLADVIWCNEKRIASDNYNPNNWTGTYNTGIGTTKTNYAVRERLDPVATAAPSLVCLNSISTDNQYTKLSKYTASDTTYGNGDLDGYKIGLLTADEVAFAGSINATMSSSYTYLYKNASSTSWWTMSPGDFNSTTFMYMVSGTNGRISATNPTSVYGVRPAVALKTGTLVSGSGTQADPYVVME